MELGIRIGAMAIPRAPRAEHHVAALHRTLVHLTQMHRREVDLEGALVAEGLEADGTLHPLLARRRIDELAGQVDGR